LRDPRSLDDEADDVRGELLTLDDGMHATSTWMLVSAPMVARTPSGALPAHGPVLRAEGHPGDGPPGGAGSNARRAGGGQPPFAPASSTITSRFSRNAPPTTPSM
ncbi:MAG TPA: hypothetical protein VFY23_10365, partial [Candidatus Limnocylindrales bacterium]|nr:hypothetical protein [Candidatus Limnocylindrales bacterium]